MAISTSNTWRKQYGKSICAFVFTAITFAFVFLALALIKVIVGWFDDSIDIFQALIYLRNWVVEEWMSIKLDGLRNSVFAAQVELVSWGLAIGATFWLIRSTSLSDWADFHFFSEVDEALLQPLPTYTGILKWAGPQGQQEDAWNRMREWLPNDKTWYVDNKHKWRSRKPNVQKSFSWMVLSGPNGMGKTQLSLEFGKSLMRERDTSSTSSWDGQSLTLKKITNQIAIWWNRDCDAPLDVGCLRFQSTDAVAHLMQWRPRRPTLIILDDPLPSLFPEQLKVLVTNQKLFCYPVRLLVVDQFEPVTTLPKGDGGLKERSATISSVEFSIEACGTALRVNLPEAVETESTPTVQHAHVKELWDFENRNQFHAHTHGFPLIVALGALWLLRPGNTVHQLGSRAYLDDEDQITQAYRSTQSIAMGPAAHQLIEQRAMELFETLPKYDINLLKALACSTLSNGIPMDVIRDSKSNFGSLPGVDELKKMFPHHAWNPVSGKTELFPYITPSFVAEVFLTKILPEKTGESLDKLLPTLARQAWQLRPQGMARSVLRHPWRQVDLVQAIQTIPELAPEYYPELVRAFIANAVLHHGPVQVALDFIEKLTGQTVKPERRLYLDLIENIKNFCEQPSADTPNAVLLMCALACHLPDDDLQESAQQLQALLPTWWRSHSPRGRKSSLITLPSDELDSFQSLATHVLARYCQRVAPTLLTRIDTPEDFFKSVSVFWNPLNCLLYGRDWRKSAFKVRLNFRRFCSRLEKLSPMQSAVLVVEQNGAPAHQPYFIELRDEFAVCLRGEIESQLSALNLKAEASDLLLAWHWVEMAQLSSEFATNLPALFEAYTISNTLPSSRRMQVFALRFLRVMVTNAFRTNEPESATVPWKQMGNISKSLPEHYEAQFEVASAWLSIAYACSRERGHIEHTRQCVEKIEAINQALPKYSTDHELQLLRALAWQYLADAYCPFLGQIESITLAVEKLERIIQELPQYAADRELQTARIRAWRDLTLACCNEYGHIVQTRQAVERIESINQELSQFSYDHEFQLARVQAWRDLTFACAKENGHILQTRQAVERIEGINQELPQFAADRDIQLARVRAWRDLTFAYSNEPGHLVQARQAVGKIVGINQGLSQLTTDRDFQLEPIYAWRYLVLAFGNERGHIEQARVAVEKIEAINHELIFFAADREFQLERVRAWRTLAFACCMEIGHIVQTRQAVEKIEEINQAAPHFAIDHEFQRELAYAWRSSAFACCNEIGHVEKIRQAVGSIEAISHAQARFSLDRDFQLVRAHSWSYLAFTCINEEGFSSQSTEAITSLHKVCAVFPNDDDFQKLLREIKQRQIQANPLSGPTLLTVEARHSEPS